MTASHHLVVRRTQKSGRGRNKGRTISFFASGGAQFTAQALGILFAVLVSHLIARRLGAGPEADAFLLGRRLVTSVSEVVNQVVVVVFIPLIAARAASGVSTGRILGQSGGAALALGALLGAAIAVAAPALIDIVAPEFDAPTAALAERVMIILAMALPATVATVAFSACCNVKGHFGLPTTIRQLPRAAVALALLVGGGVLAIQAATAYTLAFFAVAILTLVAAVWMRSDGQRASANRKVSSAIERRSIAAILLTVGALASIWLETGFAARQGVGSVAMLDFGQRLGALCGNTLAMALALVTFTDLSRRSVAGETADVSSRVGYLILAGLALLLPVQLAFFINANAIVDVIIAHGAFSSAAVAQSSELVRWMACAPLGAFVARMLLMRVLAEERLPLVKLVGVAVVLDILTRVVLLTLLTPFLGLLAIPIALMIAPFVPVAFLVAALPRKEPFAWLAALKLARGVLAASALGSCGIVVGAALGPALATGLALVLGEFPKLDSLAQLAASGVLGGLAFATGLKFFGVGLKTP